MRKKSNLFYSFYTGYAKRSVVLKYVFPLHVLKKKNTDANIINDLSENFFLSFAKNQFPVSKTNLSKTQILVYAKYKKSHQSPILKNKLPQKVSCHTVVRTFMDCRLDKKTWRMFVKIKGRSRSTTWWWWWCALQKG